MVEPLAALTAADAGPIRALILDVDGVLTDGGIWIENTGVEAVKRFDVKDGAGIKYWHRVGYKSALLTGRGAPSVLCRAQELGIHSVQTQAKQKLPALGTILQDLEIPAVACAYVGDDLPDLPPMRAVGLAITVADAVAEVKEAARFVTERPGGQGAVREVVEALLKAQGRWGEIMARYEPEPGA